MKGYLLLVLFSVAAALLIPLSALPFAAEDGTTPPTVAPSDDTSHPTEKAETDADDAACFKVKNSATGEVLTMTEEEFLIGIVSCEMAPSSPVEALKAQAVAAYTYYCRQRNAAEGGVFSNVPDVLFTTGTIAGMQERFGDQFDHWYGVLRDVVQAVAGQRVLYNGEPITACYHAISAGLTENATDVWGGDYPYLKPVDSSGDLTAEGYESTVSLTADELTAALKSADSAFQPGENPAVWFEGMETTDSGFVKKATVCGTDFTGTKLREALSLRSACFTVQYTEEKFLFTVHGYGHNVGMSQAGAKYMAAQGAGYREILLHYYPSTTIA